MGFVAIRPGQVGDMVEIAALATTGRLLPCSGRTIGNASSAGTERANADTQALFIHLWNNFANTELPVSGGRGGSALADFNANKNIQLPDIRGRATVGKDDMGGTPANRITSGESGITGTTLGATGGAQTHALTTAQLAAHGHAVKNAQGGVTEPQNAAAQGFAALNTAVAGFTTTAAAAAQPFIQNTGSGNTHQNTQPSFICLKAIRY